MTYVTGAEDKNIKVAYMANRNEYLRKWRKTKIGFISTLYIAQKANSKNRGHDKPTYTVKWLSEWIMSKKLFHDLFCVYEKSGYKSDLAPSVDRIDDFKGYTKENIQLTTWGENKRKYNIDRKNNINHRQSSPVRKFSIDGMLINQYDSIKLASLDNDIKHQSISKCCSGGQKTAGGFKWEYINKKDK